MSEAFDLTREMIAAMSDHELGQHYYWQLDMDPFDEQDATHWLMEEVDRRGLKAEQMGKPFEGMEAVFTFTLEPEERDPRQCSLELDR